jgi:hypothetical protein
MYKKWILIFCGLVTLVFGIAYVLYPIQTISLLGFATDNTGELLARFIGVVSLGYVASIWSVRRASTEVQKPTLLGAFVAMFGGFIVTFITEVTGRFGPLGWFVVGMFGLASIMFGIFVFSKENS